MSPITTHAFESQIGKMLSLIEDFLPLKDWGFQENCRFASQKIYPTIIFNSEHCRVRFSWNEGYAPRMEPQSIHISYGRLHAPNNEDLLYWMVTNWNGENYYCWHDPGEFALNFLDGLSPQDAIEARNMPKMIKQIRESDVWHNTSNEPERQIKSCAILWQHYQQRLFDLFDLRKADLWEDYIFFLSECVGAEKQERQRKGIPTFPRPAQLPDRNKVI